jgi:hypothetical protein
MKAIRKLCSELDRLEESLAQDVADFAELLAPLPLDRDAEELHEAWSTVASARRKLSLFLKNSLQSIDELKNSDRTTLREIHRLKTSAKTARRKLRYWGRFQSIMLQQIRPVRCALIRDRITPNRDVDVMDHVVTMCLDALHKVANPTAHTQSQEANARGAHRDVPLPMIQFTKMIGAARRVCLAQSKTTQLRFLDVGSGGGTKVLAATTCFDICDGLEYEKSTVESGSWFLKLLGNDTCNLIQADALEFSGYGLYDAIYFYRPLVSNDAMIALETRILSQTQPGTVLIVAGELASPGLADRGVHKLDNHVYVTGMSRADAMTLRDQAEHMGTMVPGYGRRPVPNLGYWKTLSDASARNGYHV